jgi:hypothetical protein
LDLLQVCLLCTFFIYSGDLNIGQVRYLNSRF